MDRGSLGDFSFFRALSGDELDRVLALCREARHHGRPFQRQRNSYDARYVHRPPPRLHRR